MEISVGSLPLELRKPRRKGGGRIVQAWGSRRPGEHGPQNELCRAFGGSQRLKRHSWACMGLRAVLCTYVMVVSSDVSVGL